MNIKPLSYKQSLVMGFRNKKKTAILLAVGAIRSGKTFVAVWAYFLYTQKLKQGYTHLLLGRKSRTIEEEVLPTMRFFAHLAKKKFDYRYNDQVLVIGRQRYLIASGNDEKSKDRFVGMTAHSALLDEVTLMPEGFVEMAIARCSFGASKIWLCANPQGPGNFIKKDYMDKGLIDVVVGFLLTDNPSLEQEVIDRYKRLYSGVFAARYLEGLWAAASGLIWPTWHKDNPQITPGSRCVVGVDYGISISGTAILPMVHIRDEHWNVPKVTMIRNSSTKPTPIDSEIAEKVWATVDEFKAQIVTVDPSASSLISLLRREKGSRVVTVKKANNDLQVGLRDTSGHLAQKRITIADFATDLLEDVGSYVWDEKEEGVPLKAGKNQHDPCDALRYAAMECFKSGVFGVNFKEHN